MDYTTEQQSAIQAGVGAIQSGAPLFKIGGYAGTGKTTILKAIAEQVPNPAIVAYMGAATNVLRKKGLDASTIHRKMYRWDNKEWRFYLNDSVGASCFILDEASMVGGGLYEDMCRFGIPILAIGDPGQLEPVFSGDVDLMKEPDIVLQEIHRQAKDSRIVNLATAIRCDEEWCVSDCSEPFERFDPLWADVVVCGFNKTRTGLNNRIRKARGFVGELCAGETLVCLSNDRQRGVFNGMTFTVLGVGKVGRRLIEVELQCDDGTVSKEKVFLCRKCPPYSESRTIQGIICDYGYARTCHKMIGSEEERVAVIWEESELWDQRRWGYTAVTRASELVRIFN